MPERDGLIARIRLLRRVEALARSSPPQAAETVDQARLQDLAQRVAHLEQLLEGLQDSVHRESARQAKLIADLQAQIQPSAMGAALDRDARERGL